MAFSDPEQNISQFGLTEGMHVADLGSGSGLYARAAAGRVGNSGRVYAVDIQKELLSHIKNNTRGGNVVSSGTAVIAPSRRSSPSVSNIETIWGDIERLGGTKLRDGMLDAAIAANVLFQVEDKEQFVAEVRRILKPGGKVLVVDWHGSFGGLGPHPEHLVPEASARSLFERAGFSLERSVSAGAQHYGFVAAKRS